MSEYVATKERFSVLYSHVKNQPLTDALNSYGSNIFFDFGEKRLLADFSGRSRKCPEWSIWLANTGWRISKDNIYLVGSGDSIPQTRKILTQMIGSRLSLLKSISNFFEIGMSFDEEWLVESFYHQKSESQWVAFCPTFDSIGIKGCKKHLEQFSPLHNATSVSEKLRDIILNLKPSFKSVEIDRHGVTKFEFLPDFSVISLGSSWRLEKDGIYCVGLLDEQHDIDKTLKNLEGETLQEITITSPFQDATLHFTGGYLIKFFTCSNQEIPWFISHKNKRIYEPKILILISSMTDSVEDSL